MVVGVVGLCLALASSALVLPTAPLLPRSCTITARRILMMADDDTSGKGFGTSDRYAAEEARGRAALEKMRADQAERGYDSTLQGLQDRVEEPQPTAEELNEFKSQLTLGFAGFLILGGIFSLFVGGSIWEQNENAPMSGPEEAPAFGFKPSSTERAPPPSGETAPSWASLQSDTPEAVPPLPTAVEGSVAAPE